ncbi:MAG TPA: hypothetical protein VN193_06060 [Candidatus Angelobacter sp.]|jgi:hypothetical protein|nr:hypothetical protein [Candidatus Angelobacter sp.]
MALLAAPVSAPAEEPWLRACAAAGMDFHVLRSGDGGDAGLGRGLEDLIRAAELRGCVWVARLAGPAESVAYAASVIGVASPGGESVAMVLRSSSQAMAAVVDGCSGARHRVVLAQCDAADGEVVRSALAGGDVGGALRRARVAVLRQAECGWAVAGLRPAAAALLWRVAVPGPSARLPGMPAPEPRPAARLLGVVRDRVPATLLAAAGHAPLGARRRLPTRVGAVLAAVLVAVVAVVGAGWVVVHRAQGVLPEPGPGAAAVPANTPPPRDAAMAATWDRSGEVILFGGAEAGSGHGIPYADTWRGALQPGAAWQQVDTAVAPSPRLAGAVAADPADGYVLLYGGEGTGDGGLGDTWTYGGTWTQLQPRHAPPPGPALAATEPGTGRVVLVTACCALGPVPTGDRMQTWRWDGSDWLSAGAAPGWVTNSSLVADGWDGTVVMVAARGDGLGSTFVWDGAAWRQATGVMQPPVAPGTHPQLTYDPRSRTVLDVVTGFDGQHSTWAWDGSVWSEKEAGGGPPVVGMVLAEPVDGHAVLYGGTATADEFTQRWYWTGTGWAESIRPPAVAAQPAPVFAEAAATDPGSGGVVLFGGNQALDQTWVWSGSAWTQAFFTSPPPLPRMGASMAYDPVGRQALMVDGELADGTPAADMWAWGGHSWTQLHPPGGLPPPATLAPMAWDRAHGDAVLVVPSATGGPLPVLDTWVWDGAAWSRHATAVSPPERSGSSMAFDPATGGVLLLVPCCQGSTTQQSETWRWDGAAWQRLQTRHAAPLHATVATDVVHGRVLLVASCCAGFDGGTVGPPQTWSWDGVDWTPLAGAPLPALQDVGTLATDASGAVVLAGRLAGAGPRHPLDGVWRWTGAAWEREF